MDFAVLLRKDEVQAKSDSGMKGTITLADLKNTETALNDPKPTNATNEEEKGESPDVFLWYLSVIAILLIIMLVFGYYNLDCLQRFAFANIFIRRQSVYVISDEQQTPPPPYELFAPPSYESIFPGTDGKIFNKKCTTTTPD